MSSTDLPNCINAKLNRYFKQLDGEKASGVLKMVVQESEAITIKFILDKVKKNQSEAAKILGMNRGTLLDKQILLIVDYTHSKALVVKYTVKH
jgi:Fis family transcriptional regulator